MGQHPTHQHQESTLALAGPVFITARSEDDGILGLMRRLLKGAKITPLLVLAPKQRDDQRQDRFVGTSCNIASSLRKLDQSTWLIVTSLFRPGVHACSLHWMALGPLHTDDPSEVPPNFTLFYPCLVGCRNSNLKCYPRLRNLLENKIGSHKSGPLQGTSD